MSPTPSRTKLWKLRLITVSLALLPFVFVEGCLRIFDLPKRLPPVDPLVDLHHLKPLFELDKERLVYSIPDSRLNLFRPVSFSARKPQGTFRIFCLGESTTQGEPYSTETAFSAWLKINLEVATEDKPPIEVINCGGLSYASYRILAILREVLQYEPDLIVLYVGQNEFLEKRSYAGWENVPLEFARAQGWLQDLRLVQMARLAIEPSANRPQPGILEPTELQAEVDALLDYAGGLEAYHRDDAIRTPIVAHYRWNLEAMVDACEQAKIPLILMRPVVNLLDCPPMKFELAPTLDEQQKKEFEAAWEMARHESVTPEQSLAHLRKALEIDPRHAGALFMLGRLYASQGDWEKADYYLRLAKDFDVCPLRALTEIQDSVTEIASRRHVPIVDAERLFSERSEHGIVGNRWLVDHIHPGVEGHQLLGEALAEQCLREGWLIERDGEWREKRKERVRSHLASLGETYFLRGKQRLEGLMLWTQGRAKKVRVDQGPPR